MTHSLLHLEPSLQALGIVLALRGASRSLNTSARSSPANTTTLLLCQHSYHPASQHNQHTWLYLVKVPAGTGAGAGSGAELGPEAAVLVAAPTLVVVVAKVVATTPPGPATDVVKLPLSI